jgi:Poly(3-hydroxybutyrate) depolymerase
VLNFWAENSTCLDLNDTIVHNSQYTFIKWTSCDCNSEVHHYITQDGGHSWPGVSNFIDATDLIWSFFQQYTLECSTLSISNDVIGKNKIFVYPNPTLDIITLKGINSLADVSYIHLLDNKGTLLNKSGINETQVDLSSFSPGIYFLEIKNQLGSRRVKVIKQ